MLNSKIKREISFCITTFFTKDVWPSHKNCRILGIVGVASFDKVSGPHIKSAEFWVYDKLVLHHMTRWNS